MPVIRKLAADPAAVTLYTNSDDEAAVTVTADPDIALEGLEWTLKPGNIAEVVTGEGGTAVIKAATAGKGTLTVKEPGGKTVGIRVTVDVPVESVSLSWSGNAGPGNVVKVSADVQPKNAGNRKVEWSLDVDKEVAAINDYGRLKINRNTPEGTVIVVTCTAPGAKVPIVEKIEIVVGEKK